MALSRATQSSPEMRKKNPQKDGIHLKKKTSSHYKRYKKDIEKGEKWKTKTVRKVLKNNV